MFKKIFGSLKTVALAPKKYVEASVRRKVIAAVVSAIAAIMLVYGHELPVDIQNSLIDLINGILSAF